MVKGYLFPREQLAAFREHWKTDILPCRFPLFRDENGSLFFDPATPVREIEWLSISYESRFHLPKREPMYYECDDEEGLENIIRSGYKYGLELVPQDFEIEIETIAACLNLFDSFQKNEPVIPLLLGWAVYSDGLSRASLAPLPVDNKELTPFTPENLEAWFAAHIGNDLHWESQPDRRSWILTA